MEDYSIYWNARLGSAIAVLPRGQCVVKDGDGDYVISTLAARTSLGTGGENKRSAGIAKTAADSINRSFGFQFCGVVPSELSGLGTGAQNELVHVDDNGYLARGTGVDVVGRCDADGTAYVLFGGVAISPEVDPTLPGGDPGDTQHNVADTSFGGAQLGIAGEYYGLLGDNSTDNAAAFLSAIAAFNGGVRGEFALNLGSKRSYKTSGMDRSITPGTPRWPFAMSLNGQGPGSVIKLSGAGVNAIVMADTNNTNRAKETHFTNFRVEGTATGHYGDGLDTGQDAIENGFIGNDGASRMLVHGASGYRLRGRFWCVTALDALSMGPRVSNSFAEDCVVGFYAAGASDYVNCQALFCKTGVAMTGNIQWRGGSIQSCTTGVQVIAGGNDAHGVFSGRLVHNTRPIDVQAISNGFLFDSCLLFEGDIRIANGSSLVQFVSGHIDATTYTLNGKSVWFGVTIGDGYYFSNDTTGGQNEFIAVRDNTGNIPAWVGAHMQTTFSFATDANETLTAQKSVAELVIITTGASTQSRQITSVLLPRRGTRRRFLNNSPYAHTFKFATGGTVVLRPGHMMTIGADDTDAMVVGDGVLNDTIDTLTNKTLTSPIVNGTPVYRVAGLDIVSYVTKTATVATTQVNCGTVTLADNTTAAVDVIVRCSRDTSNTKRGVWKFSAVVSRNGAGAVLDVLNVGDAFDLTGGSVTCDVNSNDFRVRITPTDTDARKWDSEIRVQVNT